MSSFPGEDPALQVIHSPPSEKLTSPFLESDSNRDETNRNDGTESPERLFPRDAYVREMRGLSPSGGSSVVIVIRLFLLLDRFSSFTVHSFPTHYK